MIISDIDLTYIASFTDGEGYLAIGKKKPRNWRHYPGYNSVFEVSNTNNRILEHLKKITRLGIVELSRKQRGNWKTNYTWQLRTNEIRYIIPIILPFLKIKSRQAEILQEFLKLQDARKKHTPLTVEEFVAFDLLWEEISLLNEQGINDIAHKSIPFIYEREISFSTLTTIAGFFDGEGTLTITKKINDESVTRYPHFTQQASISNTHEPIHDWLKGITHLGIISRSNPNKTKDHHSECSKWQLRVDEMRFFLPLLLPHLRMKRRQCEILIEFNNLPQHDNRWERLTPEEFVTRDLLWEEVTALNRRGC